MYWTDYIFALCELRDKLYLLDNYDPEHPIFQALDCARPEMSAESHAFCQDVIKEFRQSVPRPMVKSR